MKFFLGVFIFLFLPSFIEAKVTLIPEIEVVGEAIQKEKSEISIKSEALPAEVHIITKEDIEKMPVRHYLDLFRKTPAMITSHYGQGDVADGLGMRGYTSGHGSQIAFYVDGVPINVPHHSHSHGFGDIGWITPEMIERIEIIKGPFSALYGNFALGGVINIITKKSDKSPSIGAEIGTYGAIKGIATLSNKEWTPTPFLVYEAYTKDGYRDNSDYTRYNLFNKITLPLWEGDLSIRANYVKRDWGAPGYLSVNDVRNVIRKRTDAINQTDGGDSEYYNLVLNYSPKKGEEGLHGTLYVSKENHNRYGTWPPAPQRREHNERIYYGWNFLYNYLPLKNLSLVFGTDGRYDDGSMRRHDTINRRITATSRDWDMEELSLGLFLQSQWKPTEYLKFVGGLRYDHFDFDVTNKIRPNNSGKGDTSIISPKIGFVIIPIKSVNIFANKGLGFRTPSVAEMSPFDRDYKNFNLKPAKVDTWDVGLNTTLFEKLYLGIDYYQTDMENEIRVVGAETLTIGKSERKGYDIEAKFYATNDIALFATYGWVKGRIKNPAIAGQNMITGLPKNYIATGIEWQKALGSGQRLGIDLTYQYLGKSPLDAAGTLYRPTIDRYIARLSYEIKNIKIFADVAYHPKKYASEGMFLSSGVVTYDPKPKWDVSAGVKYQF